MIRTMDKFPRELGVVEKKSLIDLKIYICLKHPKDVVILEKLFNYEKEIGYYIQIAVICDDDSEIDINEFPLVTKISSSSQWFSSSLKLDGDITYIYIRKELYTKESEEQDEFIDLLYKQIIKARKATRMVECYSEYDIIKAG
jgi:hypothetical protein